ncbi:MAG: hypothetical protein JMN27_03275 [gamma proteobacterium endosymbiont of Lamellibrachia anaximandri]|nr:hypothetical protein [gamma proteobacterium endosymbiont of Lamellibrachia anaximandri]MBL3532835.1 hypothetical protein [gamma proteobacterium endosymbiont of Lamellibrachia anaximandri]
MTKKILVGALLIAVLVGAMVWSYERGMAANSALEATKLMVAVQIQIVHLSLIASWLQWLRASYAGLILPPLVNRIGELLKHFSAKWRVLSETVAI